MINSIRNKNRANPLLIYNGLPGRTWNWSKTLSVPHKHTRIHTNTCIPAHLQTHAHKNRVLTHSTVFNLSKCFSTPPSFPSAFPPSALFFLSHTSPFLMLPLMLPSTLPSNEDTDAHFCATSPSSLYQKSLPLLPMLVSRLKDVAVQRIRSLIRLDWCFVTKQINQTYTHCIYTWAARLLTFLLSRFCKHTVL